MNKGEREDLQRLIRQREKAMKEQARLRSKQLLAHHEKMLMAEFSFDSDEVWSKAMADAAPVIAAAQRAIEKRCIELGIPKKFAPSMSVAWLHKGYRNAVAADRNEERKSARIKVEAIEQEAVAQISMMSVEAQTRICAAGLTSDQAQAFLSEMKSVEELMPLAMIEPSKVNEALSNYGEAEDRPLASRVITTDSGHQMIGGRDFE